VSTTNTVYTDYVLAAYAELYYYRTYILTLDLLLGADAADEVDATAELILDAFAGPPST
jgi:hypothetical protein